MHSRQKGVILIIVLWFLAVITVMIAALANDTRLSAIAVSQHKSGLEEWAHTNNALQLAQMEIIINNMASHPDDAERQEFLLNNWPWQHRFDGRPMNLAYLVEEYDELDAEYRLPEQSVVRIYDHAGKINLATIQRADFRRLLELRVGDEPDVLDDLLDAWQDWLDRDDLVRPRGAEKEYYQELDNPYNPRNGNLESVQELLLIRGFADIYRIEEMDAAFTIYGSHTKVNPNLATREALNMLPGGAGISEQILVRRRTEPILNPGMLSEYANADELADFMYWISFESSLFYTVIIQHQQNLPQLSENDIDIESIPPSKPTQAYAVILQTRGIDKMPKILQVNPYAFVPDQHYEWAILLHEQEK